jgi:hypothetical protein
MEEELHGTAFIIHGSNVTDKPNFSKMNNQSSCCMECNTQLSGSPDNYKVEVMVIAGVEYVPVERLTEILGRQ